MFLALAQLTNKAFTDAGKGRIRQSLTALVQKIQKTHIEIELCAEMYSNRISRKKLSLITLPLTLNESWIARIYRGKAFYSQLNTGKMLIDKQSRPDCCYSTDVAHKHSIQEAVSDSKPQVKLMLAPSISFGTHNY